MVTDWSEKLYTIDMALELEKSGLTMYNVMDRRRSLVTVLTMVGAHTTVLIRKTCPSNAPTSLRRLQLCRPHNTSVVQLACFSCTNVLFPCSCAVVTYKLISAVDGDELFGQVIVLCCLFLLCCYVFIFLCCCVVLPTFVGE